MVPYTILLLVFINHPVIRAEGLIAQLGSPSYYKREMVGRELASLGRSSIAAISRGQSNRDPEIAERCRRLLPLAEVEAVRQRVAFLLVEPPNPVPDDVPLAKRLFAITGDNREARQLYVEIYVANSAVLDSIAKAGSKGGDVFWEWVEKLLRPSGVDDRAEPTGLAPTPRQIIARGDVALYWLLSSDPSFQSVKSRSLARLCIHFEKSAAARDAIRASNGTALRRLLCARLGGPRNYDDVGAEASRVQEAFKLVADAKLKEALPIVRKVALDKNEWHVPRAAAIMTLMRIGERTDVQTLSAMISDDTTLGASKAGQTMLGDVALAACVSLSGQEFKDYGFKQADDGQASGSSDPLHFGFFETSSRDAARAKWMREGNTRGGKQ
jgi:hypothetical protein